MKKKLLTILMLAAVGSTCLFSADSPYTLEARGTLITNDLTPKIEARLQWVVVTNWADANYSMRTLMGWTGDKDPNITTHFEQGTLCSNLMAVVNWKGQPKDVLLESIPFSTMTRSYILKTTTERVYR
jgi:hypothetical protein